MTIPFPEPTPEVRAGADAIRALNRRLHERDGDTYRASPEDLAVAVLSTLPEARIEEAPIQALVMDRLERDTAEFRSGTLTVTMLRGEWLERGMPTRIWVSILDDHPARSAAI